MPIFQEKTDTLVKQLADIQENADVSCFFEGIFPSYRRHAFLPYRRPDNNLFCTAITLFTLQKASPFLSETSQVLIAQMSQKATAQYSKFKNKNGLPTYNFFPTQPPNPFANGYFLHRFKHFELADDADDTALAYLTTRHSDTELYWLKNKLIQYSNGFSKPITTTFQSYKSLKAYTTWFGKNMLLEFDACVLCNILYFIFENKLPLNEHDEASLLYLQQIVLTNQYLENPFKVSHHYACAVIIGYHLARLMSAFYIPLLEICREKLYKDFLLLYSKSNNYKKMLLQNAIFFLDKLPPEPLPLVEAEEGVFFVAGFLSSYEHKLLQKLASQKLFQLEWICEAHTLALQVENLVLRERLKQ